MEVNLVAILFLLVTMVAKQKHIIIVTNKKFHTIFYKFLNCVDTFDTMELVLNRLGHW